MHRVVQDQLEKALSATPLDPAVRAHLAECRECSAELQIMREHARAFETLRTPAEVEPRPGFYARVLERIEAEGPGSIWDIFFESPFGHRIAYASLALALLLGVYIVTMERVEEPMMATEQSIEMPADSMLPSMDLGVDIPAPQVTSVGLSDGRMAPDQDSVLVNLVTYREQ